jgi:hypothetical protein
VAEAVSFRKIGSSAIAWRSLQEGQSLVDFKSPSSSKKFFFLRTSRAIAMREAWRVIALAVTREVYLPLVGRQASFISFVFDPFELFVRPNLGEWDGRARRTSERRLGFERTTAALGCRRRGVFIPRAQTSSMPPRWIFHPASEPSSAQAHPLDVTEMQAHNAALFPRRRSALSTRSRAARSVPFRSRSGAVRWA